MKKLFLLIYTSNRSIGVSKFATREEATNAFISFQSSNPTELASVISLSEADFKENSALYHPFNADGSISLLD